MTDRTRVIYIAGPYRHWRDDGTRDADKEAEEVADETRWARAIIAAGCAPVRPLRNSVDIDDCIAEDDWVKLDTVYIARLRPNFDAILLRPGAYGTLPNSKGASAELEEAKAAELLILYGCQGEERIADYLRTLCLPFAGEEGIA